MRIEVLIREKGEEFLPEVEEFKSLGVLFTNEGRVELDRERRIGVASAAMLTKLTIQSDWNKFPPQGGWASSVRKQTFRDAVAQW